MYYADDYIMRQIELGIRGMAKVLFGKEDTIDLVSIEQDTVSQEGLLLHLLKKLLYKKKVNEAENLLFETIEQDPQISYLKTALAFYEELQSWSDEELQAGDFSRQEIADGLKAINRLYQNP